MIYRAPTARFDLLPLKFAAIAALVIATAGASRSAQAAYVTPKMGGAQQSASMVMPNVKFTGTGLTVTGVVNMMGMPIVEIPVLRPLTGSDEFDPNASFNVLIGKAYNFQYGWNLDATSLELPSGGNLWIEVTSQTPGLETFEHGSYTPILGTQGSSSKWLWDGTMAHNPYAVDPSISNWSATYHLYLGDYSGNALQGYSGADLTLSWTSVPEPASMLSLICGGGMLLIRRRHAAR